MIIAYVGLPGSGKTYRMVQDALREKKRHDRDIYANFPMVGAHYYKDLSELMEVKNGIILADELNSVAPAHGWQSLPTTYMNIWTQSRKMGIDFWYTTQGFAMVNNQIRCITNYVWKCRHMFASLHRVSKYDAVDVERDRIRIEHYDRKYFLLSKKIFVEYDSYRRVLPRGYVPGTDPHCLPVFNTQFDLISPA